MSAPIFETYQSNRISVDGDDLIVDGQVLPIRQKLIFKGLEYVEDLNDLEQYYNGLGSSAGNIVVVKIKVLLYKKNTDGTFGERWKGGLDYVFNMIANNTTWVDNTTGEIVGNVGEELIPENVQAALYDAQGGLVEPAGKFYGRTVIKEGEFFDRIGDGEYQPGVRTLITQYMTANKSRVQPPQSF